MPKVMMLNERNVDRSERNGVMFFCPGCKHHHYMGTSGKHQGRPVWQFNGDLERPTLTPSLLVFVPEHRDKETGAVLHERQTICHLFVTDGQLHFLNDSQHELAGQIVDMRDENDHSDFVVPTCG